MATQGEYFANNPEIVKIFDDMERFKLFCKTAYLFGHDGYTWDEKICIIIKVVLGRLTADSVQAVNVNLITNVMTVMVKDVIRVIGDTNGNLYCRH